MIKLIIRFFKYVFDMIELGFYHICLILSKGFFFYFYSFFSFLRKLFQGKLFNKPTLYFQNKQRDPVSFLLIVLFFFVGVFLHTYLYVDKNDLKYVDSSVLESSDDLSVVGGRAIASDKETYTNKEINLYRKYGKMNIKEISFEDLKKVNSDVVAWIMVDGTNINYPVVQTNDNSFYLNHDIMKNPKASGWIFMDYRNTFLEDQNTIFYGHNLLNKTAFGSISNIFTNSWFQKSNHYVLVRVGDITSVYEVFSCYYIDPEVYYLQNRFFSDYEYTEFLNTLKSRSIFDFGLELSSDDKIITLSTCTDDNKGRKVVHAKKIR